MLNNLRLFIRIAAGLTLAAFATASAEDKHQWGKITVEDWAVGAPASFPEAAAVVIFDLGSLEVEQPYEGNVTTFRRHVRARVLNKAGAADAIAIEIPLYRHESFRGFEAVTYLPDGRKIKLDKKDTFTKKVGKRREYFTFTFPAVEDGCIVEYKYSVVSSDFGFLEPWYFQGRLFAYESEFAALIHRGLNYTAVTHNVPLELREPVREELDNRGEMPIKFTWRLTNIFPVESEPYMAAVNSYRAALFFQLVNFKDEYNNITFIEDWPSLAELVEKQYRESPLYHDKGVKEQALALTDTIADPVEKIRALYDFVRLEILTVDIEDEYVFTPQDIEKTLADRRGSAAGKNLLLLQMLRDAGIIANPVLIGTRSYALFNSGVHDLNQFNHLICLVTVGAQSHVLDCSERWVPYPYLPPESLVSGGLVLAGKKSQPVPIKPPSRTSGFHNSTKMSLFADGSAICTTHVTIVGHLLSAYKELLVAQPEADDVKETLLEDDEPSFELLDYSFLEIPGADSVGIDMIFRLTNHGDLVDNNLVTTPLLFALKSNPFKKKYRFFPVDFAYPFSVTESVEIVPGDSLTLKSVPPNLSASVRGLNYSRIVLQAGNQARIMTQLIVEKSLFAPAEYAALRETYDKIAQAGSDQCVLTIGATD